MRAGVLTGSTAMDAMDMGMGGHAMALPLFMVTWLVMMVAMMFPAIVPVVMLVHRWSTSRELGARITVPFVAGYLLLWGAAGLAAYGLLTFLESNLVGGPSLVRLGGALVVVAGVYQLTPLKDTCLNQCRSPLSLLMQHARTLQSGVAGLCAWVLCTARIASDAAGP
jgi:predicted metal-binding membrane protein